MKPFTSKHCAQYLKKSSPFNQGKKVMITDEKGREHPTDSRSAEAKHKRAQHKGRGDSHLDDQ
jgi:hypothetical protein